MDSVGSSDAGTTLTFHLAAWLLGVKVLPAKVAAGFTPQTWCACCLPGAPGDKVRDAGGEGYFCGSSVGRREREGMGGQAGRGCDSQLR